MAVATGLVGLAAVVVAALAVGPLGPGGLTPTGSPPTDRPAQPPAAVIVPEVRGMSAEDARATLENACAPTPCFAVERVDEPDEVVEAGTVFASDPTTGIEAEGGSTVTIRVSSGPAALAPRTAGPIPEGHTVYVVQSGDIFSLVANGHGLTSDELQAINPQIEDPNEIRPGDELIVPAP